MALLLLAAWRLWELRHARRAAHAPGADGTRPRVRTWTWTPATAPAKPPATRPGRPAFAVIMAVAALVVTGGLYVAVNQARFGTPLRVPYEQQRFSAGNLTRKRSLAANGNSLTSASFIPTQLLQAVRPDALRLRSTFPFVDFPQGQATLISNAVFKERSATVSLPVDRATAHPARRGRPRRPPGRAASPEGGVVPSGGSSGSRLPGPRSAPSGSSRSPTSRALPRRRHPAARGGLRHGAVGLGTVAAASRAPRRRAEAAWVGVGVRRWR